MKRRDVEPILTDGNSVVKLLTAINHKQLFFFTSSDFSKFSIRIFFPLQITDWLTDRHIGFSGVILQMTQLLTQLGIVACYPNISARKLLLLLRMIKKIIKWSAICAHFKWPEGSDKRNRFSQSGGSRIRGMGAGVRGGGRAWRGQEIPTWVCVYKVWFSWSKAEFWITFWLFFFTTLGFHN